MTKYTITVELDLDDVEEKYYSKELELIEQYIQNGCLIVRNVNPHRVDKAATVIQLEKQLD